MPLRPVPWAIGNGAENSVELARAGIYSATSGATGITEPSDFVVKALPVPGAAVRVNKGGGVIKSTYPGVFGQSYAVQEQSSTDVPVDATGSSGGATKYVYVLITDTQYGGQNPPSVEDGPYNEYAVTTTLPQNQPYLLLAQIDQPASTATITSAMITDLREIANPRTKEVVFPRPTIGGDNGLELKAGTAFPAGEWFPNVGGNDNTGRYSVQVPSWATRMQIRCEWLGINYQNDPGNGLYWVSYGPNGSTTTPDYYTQAFGWKSGGANATTNWILEQQVGVQRAWRGTVQNFYPKATRKTSGGYVGLTSSGGMVFKIRFLQEPDE